MIEIHRVVTFQTEKKLPTFPDKFAAKKCVKNKFVNTILYYLQYMAHCLCKVFTVRYATQTTYCSYENP